MKFNSTTASILITASYLFLVLPTNGDTIFLESVLPELHNPQADNCGVSITVSRKVVVNDDDDQPSYFPDYEKWDMLHCPSIDDDDLEMVTLTAYAGKLDAYVEFKIVSGEDKITSRSDGATVFWDDEEKSAPAVIPAVIIVPAGTTFKGYYWIEGNHPSGTFEDVVFRATIFTFGGLGSDGVNYSACNPAPAIEKTTVIQTDIDIDSNNNEGTTFDYGSQVEDEIEASVKVTDGWPRRPGKFVVVNTGNSDGVPDWADGFDVNSAEAEDDHLDIVDFVPLLIEKPSPFGSVSPSDICEVRFDYSAADPSSVICLARPWNPAHPYEYAKGSTMPFRLWRKDAQAARDMGPAPPGDFIPTGQWIKWESICTTSRLRLFCEAMLPSTTIGDQKIKVTMRQRGLECTDEITVTALQFDSEPITNRGAPKVSNPAGLIDGDNAAYFFCEMKPADYPPDKIKWSPDGACQITSPSDRGLAISAGGTSSNVDFRFNIDVPGMYTPVPEFHGKSLSLKTISLKCFILRNSSGNDAPINVAGIDSLLVEVNDIYKQAALQFVRSSVEFIDNTAWHTSLNDMGPVQPDEYSQMQSTYDASGDEAEVYFIRQLDSRSFGLNWNEQGSPAGLSVALYTLSGVNLPYRGIVLAHELGHSLGLDDVYPYTTKLPQLFYGDGIPADITLNPRDWNSPGETSPRYYMEERKQVDLIKTALMCGFSDFGTTYDIPLGTIHGLDENAAAASSAAIEVGLDSIEANGRTPHH